MGAFELIGGAAAAVGLLVAFFFGDLLVHAFLNSKWGRRIVVVGAIGGAAFFIYLTVEVLR